jgi:hypothetical protein
VIVAADKVQSSLTLVSTTPVISEPSTVAPFNQLASNCHSCQTTTFHLQSKLTEVIVIPTGTLHNGKSDDAVGFVIIKDLDCANALFIAVNQANHPAGTANQSFNVLLLAQSHCGI